MQKLISQIPLGNRRTGAESRTRCHLCGELAAIGKVGENQR